VNSGAAHSVLGLMRRKYLVPTVGMSGTVCGASSLSRACAICPTKEEPSMPRVTLTPAIVVAALAFAPTTARAKTAPIDVTHSSVTCNTVSGVMAIKPSLRASGGPTSTVVKLKGTLADCTVTPNPFFEGPFTVSGTFNATLSGTTNHCGTFFTSGDPSLTGPLTVKWRPDQTTPILPTSTKVTVINAGGFTFSSGWGTEYQQLNVDMDPFSSTGAFLPVPAITLTGMFLIAIEDVRSINAGCSSPTGLKKLHFGFGRFSSN